MFNHPRRPYYNYGTTIRENVREEVSTIEHKRFWKLLNQLKRKTGHDSQDEQAEPARTG